MKVANLMVGWLYSKLPEEVLNGERSCTQEENNSRNTVCYVKRDGEEIASRTLSIKANDRYVDKQVYVDGYGQKTTVTTLRQVTFNRKTARYLSFRKLMSYCAETGLLNRSERRALWNEFLATVKSSGNSMTKTVYGNYKTNERQKQNSINQKDFEPEVHSVQHESES